MLAPGWKKEEPLRLNGRNFGGDSRPATNRELQRTREHLKAMYAGLRSAITEEVRQQ